MSKIGILGGTFDPIHLAHLKIAETVKQEMQLDEVWFMPTKLPPHKNVQEITKEEIRAKMIMLAIKGMEGFVYSDFELKWHATTYTAETLARLNETYTEHTFYFIMGGDSLWQFSTWYHPEIILQNAIVVAVGRDGISFEKMQQKAEELSEKYKGTICVVRMEQMDISSSMIREKIRKNEQAEPYLPSAVYQYIKETGCYSQEG